MRLLGAIIAGGASRRFGSDKASARIAGRSLLDHACSALAPQVDELVICGRPTERLRWISDRPRPDMGPLGGINAALADASARGFDAVITVPVDVFPLPRDLVDRMNLQTVTVFARQHLIGCWPTALAAQLDAHLAEGHRSLRSWITATNATLVDDHALDLGNINRPDDLRRAVRVHGNPTQP
ncbi:MULTISPECIES: molybdenum cofactor guanylyltransferase [unclassified Sphingomonas]|uniref:molybdenum cofactor guanylyltransferase n=1 Tax=unclassified Sphingomonas TaxID=196159 RepID=UPI0008303EB7|nr:MULTISPECIES: molybdenum cofactor guanylyltransferase [unclassified Sphingomonas]